MDFRIADTFTISFARLIRDEQKADKVTVFYPQLTRPNRGMVPDPFICPASGLTISRHQN